MAQKMTSEQRLLVEKNINLAHHLALVVWRRNPHTMDKEEVVSAAYEGLVKAAANFDPSKADLVDGKADISGLFAGYARQKINGAILDWQKSNDHVPRRQRSTYKELQAMGHGLGRSPQELSDITGMPEDKIRSIISAVEHMPVSLTPETTGESAHLLNSSDSNWAADKMDRPAAVDEIALTAQIQDAVVSVFDTLPELQRIVIALRYYEGLDLKAIAAEIDVRIALVRDAHAEGLLTLHAAMLHQAS